MGIIQLYWALQTTTNIQAAGSAQTAAKELSADVPASRSIHKDESASLPFRLHSVLPRQRSSSHAQPRHPKGRCAINLYGLPRSFKDYVLPSLVENVIKANVRHHCDYFVHYFNKTREISGRSGSGGLIDPSDVLLLRQAVHQAYQDEEVIKRNNYNHTITTFHPPRVEFVSDTDEEFFAARFPSILDIETYPQRYNYTNNPYYSTQSGFNSDTLVNILRMWHSQTRVFELMEEIGKNQTDAAIALNSSSSSSSNASLSSSSPYYYSRVAMLRLDVIFMTPIDLYRVPNDPAPHRYGVYNREPGTDRRHTLPGPIDRSDYYLEELDFNNNHVVVPGFASYPINDRMIIGPHEAVKLWATERWQLHTDYIHFITTSSSGAKLKKFGLHDERFVAHMLVPLMRQRYQVDVMVDRNLYFLRIRADGSIWVLDSPFANASEREPKLLEELLHQKCIAQRSRSKIAQWQATCSLDNGGSVDAKQGKQVG